MRKRHILILILITIAAMTLVIVLTRRDVNPYLTETAVKRDLIQTVTASGKVESSSDSTLAFEVSGRVARIAVKEGDAVKTGDMLIALDRREANTHVDQARAALAAAEGELAKLLAGPTREKERIAVLAVENARTHLARTKARIEAAKAQAREALAEARASRDAAITNLDEDIATKLTAATTEADHAEKKTRGALNILDEIYTAQNEFNSHFTIANVEAETNAENAYRDTGSAWNKFSTLLSQWRDRQAENTAVLLFPRMVTELDKTRSTVSLTSIALTDAQLSPGAPKTLSTYRSDTATAWADINAAISGLRNTFTDLSSARRNGEAALALKQAGLRSAEEQLNTTIAESESSVAQAEGELKRTQAEYDNIMAPPRAEEREIQAARIAEAKALLSKAQTDLVKYALTSPVTGIVTKIYFKLGESVAPSQDAIRLFSPTALEVTVQTPEADIPKVVVGDPVDITLDAFGSNTLFPGNVTFINPAETLVEGVVYYEAKIAFEKNNDMIKPGMSADVTIHTDQRTGTLSIPLRAVKERQGSYTVEVLKSKKIEERLVKLGLRADGGLVEISDGLREGEFVIVGMKKKR